MTAIVPTKRPEPSESVVRVGQPVSALTWQALGGIGNWLRGKGACLVPQCLPYAPQTIAAAEVFRFRVKTRSSAIQRIWALTMRSTTGGSTVVIKAPASTGTAMTVSVGETSSVIVYIENLASQSSAESQISVEVGPSSGSVMTESISCYEQDRPSLAENTTDYGVDLFTLGSGQPIADFAYQSAGGAYDALTSADARRVGIFHWSQGDHTEAATASGTPANLLRLGVPVLARKLARTATTGSVKWAAYAKVTAGTGTITMSTTESGVSDSATVTGTSYAWTATRTVSIDCEDLSVTDGRQGSAWDEMQFAISCSGGTLTVLSISVWSDD